MRTDLAGPRTWLLAALGGWCLAVWILALLGMGGRVEPLPADASMTQPLPRLPEYPQERLAGLSEYNEISARPLFSSDRRPRPFFISGDGGEQTQAFDFVLSSVLITPGTQLAILQPTAGGESVRVQVGQAVPAMSNWQLVEVQPRSASFIGPEGPRTLELRVFDGSGGQAPTVMAPPAPVQGTGSMPTPIAGTSGPAPPAAPVPMVAPPVGTPPGAAREGATADPGDSSGQPSDQTTQQQMEAIRQRIEARRAQLRQSQPPSPPNKTQ
jgi:general secretion pathway protein N